MTITAESNFHDDRRWYGGGCLACSRNVSDSGFASGIQCIDLGREDDFEGYFGLCHDCAEQVALAVGWTKPDNSDLEQALAAVEAAQAYEESARALAAQARLDKDTVERLLGYAPEPEAVS